MTQVNLALTQALEARQRVRLAILRNEIFISDALLEGDKKTLRKARAKRSNLRYAEYSADQAYSVASRFSKCNEEILNLKNNEEDDEDNEEDNEEDCTR